MFLLPHRSLRGAPSPAQVPATPRMSPRGPPTQARRCRSGRSPARQRPRQLLAQPPRPATTTTERYLVPSGGPYTVTMSGNPSSGGCSWRSAVRGIISGRAHTQHASPWRRAVPRPDWSGTTVRKCLGSRNFLWLETADSSRHSLDQSCSPPPNSYPPCQVAPTTANASPPPSAGSRDALCTPS